MKNRFSQIIGNIVVLAVFLQPTSLHAEGATRETGATTGFEMPEAPPQPSPAAVPKPQSRSSDSGAAKALAMVGAMTAMAMCAKLMQEAKKEPDPKQKQTLMMMAMMQCQQAAQNAANAAQNGDQKDKLQENQTPQMAALAPQKPIKPPPPPSDKIDQAGLGDKPPTSDDDKSPDPEVATLTTRDTSSSGGDSTVIPPSYKRPGDDFIIPDMIDKAKITGDESAKDTGSIGTLSSTLASQSFAGMLKNSATSDLKEKGTETVGGENGTRGKGVKGGDGASEGASSTAKSSEGNSEGGMNLNDMMAGLFGGGAPGAPGFMSPQGYIEYTPVPTSASTGKKMNIFEAASYLYQQAHGKKVKKSKIANNSKPNPTTQVATLSKE